ncbi:UDP-2,4-diacetamido-2,4,6-trideoxy-beta-L-altropyranose hydrolase [Altererythrobacter sp. SALINAS58]|uniref:UDP-2,4-diacetamido-2,4, 6-trideoxy-beta-L-altropyranose hydrolase n=1 Tax=Alteripontixanthobacter muriae TaxID=2705546 RepID=UPI001576A33B|nr:UDP-2,4-diacetamido-2,4,6-trideoxy-beta-L-altropyranose hydrolase [Alteripontixanthobacter muriae]NTZ43424.1 UDP-2,4-diacetamido-2,4,6-trideoxy-beta-L-altropyranose hydrolase [Alteripontixanthobacter muriae]
MRVAIRVDASLQMGTGHLHRSLSLAQALRALGAQVRFVTRYLGVDSAAIMREQRFDAVHVLPASENRKPDDSIAHAAWAQVHQEDDVYQTTAELEAFDPDWVVVDSYSFDAQWHDSVREALDCRIAVIDDLADRNISADLLIDHNLDDDHDEKYVGVLRRPAKLLGGPQYGLLAPAFARGEKYEFWSEVRGIGIFMGGGDALNFTEKVFEAVVAAGFEGALEIVTTSANPHLPRLRKLTAGRCDTSISVDLPDLVAFFARHDLQIGAGGGATWERCCIGVPSVLIITAGNQNVVAPQLASRGIAATPSQTTVDAIAATIRALIDDPELRRELARKARETVDGNGANRVAVAMLADTLTVRPAAAGDSENLFNWRNAPENRVMMNNPEEMDWARHVAWLDRVLSDTARKLFVGEVGGQPVGSIRFDLEESGATEVSLHLDPGFHSLGLGPHLLAAGEAASGADVFVAKVLEKNRPSQLLFERGGYTRTAPESWRKDTS